MLNAFQIGRLSIEASDWAGMTKKQQLLMGTSGFIYLTLVETMDGFSKGWGFSWGDMGANLLGTSSTLVQHHFWEEQKIIIKYSYSKSIFPFYNPSLLGNNFQEELLKDYNAQIYWLSFSPLSFFKSTKNLNWLCLSIGYGASG
ncbi:MAG: DUF2279 domain-containing protein, partial [Flavobacteriales bacterium]|nr:DUF2279 domain-containing protein [Flavobacteriales bacterium]